MRYREASRRALCASCKAFPVTALRTTKSCSFALDRAGMSQIRAVAVQGGNCPAAENTSARSKNRIRRDKTALVIRRDGREIRPRETVDDLRGSLHHTVRTAGWMV